MAGDTWSDSDEVKVEDETSWYDRGYENKSSKMFSKSIGAININLIKTTTETAGNSSKNLQHHQNSTQELTRATNKALSKPKEEYYVPKVWGGWVAVGDIQRIDAAIESGVPVLEAAGISDADYEDSRQKFTQEMEKPWKKWRFKPRYVGTTNNRFDVAVANNLSGEVLHNETRKLYQTMSEGNASEDDYSKYLAYTGIQTGNTDLNFKPISLGGASDAGITVSLQSGNTIWTTQNVKETAGGITAQHYQNQVAQGNLEAIPGYVEHVIPALRKDIREGIAEAEIRQLEYRQKQQDDFKKIGDGYLKAEKDAEIYVDKLTYIEAKKEFEIYGKKIFEPLDKRDHMNNNRILAMYTVLNRRVSASDAKVKRIELLSSENFKISMKTEKITTENIGTHEYNEAEINRLVEELKFDGRAREAKDAFNRGKIRMIESGVITFKMARSAQVPVLGPGMALDTLTSDIRKIPSLNYEVEKATIEKVKEGHPSSLINQFRSNYSTILSAASELPYVGGEAASMKFSGWKGSFFGIGVEKSLDFIINPIDYEKEKRDAFEKAKYQSQGENNE